MTLRSPDGWPARPLIDVDLHMHTDHSYDCATPVEVLLATARDQGLGAIAVTDHNEISGALEARAQARSGPPVKVIVGEEVKTAERRRGDRPVPRGEDPARAEPAETVAEIQRQGGLVYVPHPFDRMHSVPDYEHLLEDPRRGRRDRGIQPAGGDRRFQRRGRALRGQVPDLAGAGSDSHVAQGLGSVRVRMRDFDGPAEFLQSLRDAEILTRPPACCTCRR